MARDSELHWAQVKERESARLRAAEKAAAWALESARDLETRMEPVKALVSALDWVLRSASHLDRE